MVADMEANKKLSHIVTDLFFRGRRLNISLVFCITILFQSAKNYATHFIMKVPNRRELNK